jgi:hypothetical protein
MTAYPFEYSFFISLLVITLYLAGALIRRQTPDLAKAVIIATACSSAVAAIFLGTMTYATPAQELGVLREHKTSIITGTLALVWVSMGSAYNSVMQPWRCQSQV